MYFLSSGVKGLIPNIGKPRLLKHQTRLGGYGLRASLQDIYLNTEAGIGCTGGKHGMETDETGINWIHIVFNHGVSIGISREYL